MLTKSLMSAVLLVGLSSFAMAQTTTTTPSTSSTTGAAGSATAKMTEAQVKQKLQQQGYSDIQLKSGSAVSGSSASTTGSGTSTSPRTSASNDMWTGTAMKSGKKVNIDVDSTGKVTER